MDKKQKMVPKLRFPGFTDDWEQRKLGDVVSLRGRIGFRGYKETDLVPMGQGAITFSPSDIDEMGKVSNENNKYLSWEKYDESPEIQVQVGDILFTKTASIGKVGYVRELKEKATINPQFALLTPNETTNGYFTFLSVRNEYFMKQVRGITGGSSVPTMSQEKLKELVFMSPDIKEQEQIGSFFESIDNLITLHQRKLYQMKNYKRGLLQKMFPKNGEHIPEIRFPGFTDSWEQRKLSDVTDEFQSGKFIAASDIEEAGEYPVYGGNGLRGYCNTYNHDGDYALIGRQGALCGNMNYSCGKAYFTEHAVAVKANSLANTRFLYYLLDKMNLGQYSDQSAQPGLAVGKLIKLENVFPSKEEQDKIGGFFEGLDNLITLHQRKLDQVKEYKKGLLQQMFV